MIYQAHDYHSLWLLRTTTAKSDFRLVVTKKHVFRVKSIDISCPLMTPHQNTHKALTTYKTKQVVTNNDDTDYRFGWENVPVGEPWKRSTVFDWMCTYRETCGTCWDSGGDLNSNHSCHMPFLGRKVAATITRRECMDRRRIVRYNTS